MSETTHARGANLEAIAAATGRGWEDWAAWLDAAGARDLSGHADVVALVLGRLSSPAGPEVANPEWWAQSVTVAWEQHTGRRAPGQRTDGSFDANASRTVPGTMDEALAGVQEVLGAAIREGDGALRGVPLAAAPSTSATAAWRYWRASFADGSRVDVTVGPRPPARDGRPRAVVAVGHRRLPTAAEATAWKGLWRELLGRL